ncbi:BrnT family toxin [Agrobacterium sp. NPDC090273]|uniref:BrnT family toxin n=1 Tax=Agrobacterium sp. NPDC090273 TaxID=3363919 RepID=UPI00383B1DBA
MLYFEWDEQKAVANLAKHGVSFETASHVFNDPFAVDIEERSRSTTKSEGVSWDLAMDCC